MNRICDFLDTVLSAVKKEVLKKLVFSRPYNSEVAKVSARLCAHRGRRLLAMEFSLPDNTVAQKNIQEADLEQEITSLIKNYKQVNVITTLGDAEYKVSKNGKEVFLGLDSLRKKLSGEGADFERAIEALDNTKNHILSGNEDFLTALGISDKTGRVHDKKQGKYRQINRFLEHIEDVYKCLPKEKTLVIYDLCCGKSYLSFAVYYYLTQVKKREVRLLGIDLKRDVIAWCDRVAKELSYTGMTFVCDDVTNTPEDETPDMVISLHACDIATDIVINRAIALKAGVILSTPCCHRYLNDKINAKALSFVTEYPQLKNKLCEAITDAIRLSRLKAGGYKVTALELTDPENTPKNTLLRAVLDIHCKDEEKAQAKEEYGKILKFVLGDGAEQYLKEIR